MDRTNQIARTSIGGKAQRKQLATKYYNCFGCKVRWKYFIISTVLLFYLWLWHTKEIKNLPKSVPSKFSKCNCLATTHHKAFNISSKDAFCRSNQKVSFPCSRSPSNAKDKCVTPRKINSGSLYTRYCIHQEIIKEKNDKQQLTKSRK